MTQQIINDSIPSVIEYFVNNPEKKYKLPALLGNINSGQIMDIFSKHDTKGIFDNIEKERQKLIVTEPYMSKTIHELDVNIKEKISELIKLKFGKRFDPQKLFNSRINSVIYNQDIEGNITSCCLVNGERIYTVVSISPDGTQNILSNLCKNNYNIWTTVSINHKFLIDLGEKSGLKQVKDSDTIKKILTSNYPEYKGRLIISNQNNYTSFTKTDSNDKPQVLLKS
ncbi:MAG: hypothetical protein WCJ59_00790 [bacterium]